MLHNIVKEQDYSTQFRLPSYDNVYTGRQASIF
jgi:hypothetical protein